MMVSRSTCRSPCALRRATVRITWYWPVAGNRQADRQLAETAFASPSRPEHQGGQHALAAWNSYALLTYSGLMELGACHYS